jgi:hypothetical protein
MKKTKKENPITFFRKADEARQKVVKASLKKAQDGIEMNDDMVNKAGSTGGYKKPVTMGSATMGSGKRAAGYANMIKSANTENANSVDKNAPDTMRAKMSNSSDAYRDSVTNKPKSKTPVMDSMYQTTPGHVYKQKKGGAVKKMAKGGATKATKFAALAPPYNKATAADRIVGAKKNAKKK